MSHRRAEKSSKKFSYNRELAHKYADAGYVVFPCREDGPKGVVKTPYTRHGFKDATASHDQIDEWWDNWPGAIVGLPTGERNGIAVLDVDQKDGKDGRATLQANGVRPRAVVVSETPSGGTHFIYAHEHGLRSTTDHTPAGEKAPGVDVRAEVAYIIAPDSVMAGGSRYRTTSKASLLDHDLRLSNWPNDLPVRKLKKREANDNHEGATRPQRVADSALMAIPNDGGRDWWRDMAAAHKSAGGSFAVFNEWSQDHASYDSRHTRQTWKSLDARKAGGITERTLYYEASENGWRDLEEDAEIRAAFDDKDYDWLEDIIAEEKKAAPANSSLVMLTPDDCDVGSRSNYVIKGFLGAGEIGTVVGPPGVGKSALTASMGYAVAQGDETFSMRTREGPVFYLACENETDMKRRVKALRDKRGPADNFHLVLGGAGNLIVGSKFHRALLKEIERQRPVLVVIDTLAAAMPGFEENSSEGMGKAIAMAKSLGKFGAAVVIVHHDTKAGDGLPRGHSSLNGIVDVNLALRREVDGVITGQCSKNRSGKSHEQIVAYENQVVELGIDQDGDAITTVICEEAELFPRTPKSLSGPNAQAMRILIDCMQGASSIPVSVWRSAFMNDEWLQSYDNKDTRRKIFDRARQGLQNLKLIAIDSEKNVRVIDPNCADMEVEEFDDEPHVRRGRRKREIEGLA